MRKTMSKTQDTEEWMVEFVNKFNTVIANAATLNSTILKFSEQLDVVYIMIGALKVTTERLLEKNFDIPKKEFDKTFNKVHAEIMSGKTPVQDEYVKSVKKLMEQHHELVAMIETFRNNPKIAQAQYDENLEL